jgi:hypothetical protein
MAAQSFRFLDLPTELRCNVYGRVEFGSIRHVLKLSDSKKDTQSWSTSLSGVDEAPSLTLIRPRSFDQHPFSLLTYIQGSSSISCMQNKSPQTVTRSLPCRLPRCTLHLLILQSNNTCHLTRNSGNKAEVFGKLCFSHLVQSPGDAKVCRRVSLTITHVHGMTYGLDVLTVVQPKLNFTRVQGIEINHMAPLPGFRNGGCAAVQNGTAFESSLIECQKSEEAEGKVPHTMIRPMSEEAFAKHLAALDVF